jgi:superfamily II DNA or RNA helicase
VSTSSSPSLRAPWGPGSLVHARGREWVVLAGSDGEVLHVRPVSGSEEEQTLIHLGLELEPVREACFPKPNPEPAGDPETALLLHDALLLSLRRAAGPFRSFGQLAFEPRPYQLVPLLMALELEPVRLLIADDVGIGKTIEAALIARELLDRGDIERLSVLCPPHLIDQWMTELETRFHLGPVAVTLANARRLEAAIPPGESLFSVHPYTIVSLDYVKSQSRRDRFLSTCPEFVIVDEAHTCSANTQGAYQRYQLLRGLAQSPSRHLVMLTATPHSGGEVAFFRLLGLLDDGLERLHEAVGDERNRLRDRLARHFVQRLRSDMAEWREGRLFPRRETTELSYRLGGAWEGFLDAVLDYCAAILEPAGGHGRPERFAVWSTFALMRCVASSPAAVAQALRTRADPKDDETLEELENRVFDGAVDALVEDDVEPPAGIDDPALNHLLVQAERLMDQAGDPKVELLANHLKELLVAGFRPVVFCRYLGTAHYLGRRLKRKFEDVTVEVVTGELTADERREKVRVLAEAERSLLIATDCLSEGINLQDFFDAVVHYDLSWNPTRHEQREGRVDRFGQQRELVRTTLIYGANNPVDRAVLEVVLREAAKLRRELGVPVPLPDDGHRLRRALMRAVVLLQRESKERRPTACDYGELDQAKAILALWQDVAEKARTNRRFFAQRRLKPEQVLPEWQKTRGAVGGSDEVRRFTGLALGRLGSRLEPLARGFRASLIALPEDVRERLECEGLTGTLRLDFTYPPAPGCQAVLRSHPLVSVLAETLLARTLGRSVEGTATDPGVLGRVGCWVSAGVTVRTTIALLRLRHRLTNPRAGRNSMLLVEEVTAFAWTEGSPKPMEGQHALGLLAAPPLAMMAPAACARAIDQALGELDTHLDEFSALAERHAQALLVHPGRAGDAAQARGCHRVKALIPADVIGIFVLLAPLD